MTTYKATGVISSIGETKEVGSNGFRKREVVLELSDGGRYENPVAFTAKKDRCSMLDGFKQGDRATVEFTVDGRRWEGPNGTRHFIDLTLWRISGEGDTPANAKDNPPVVDGAGNADAAETGEYLPF